MASGHVPNAMLAPSRSLALMWRRNDWLRGYAVLMPTLLVMLALLGAPLLSLIVLSFWTQDEFKLVRTFTIANSQTVIDYAHSPIYFNLMLRSMQMSATATVLVILTAYPIAYFLAFRVKRHKLVWIILITVPFWTSYLLRIFAW